MEKQVLPIEYKALVASAAGAERELDLEEPGWATLPEVTSAVVFTLKPKDDAEDQNLPIVSVHLRPLPDGKPRKLVYFSRVYGRVVTSAEEKVSSEQRPLFRIYCVGWEAEVGGRTLRVASWIYPGGSIVMADEPPYVNDMIEHFAQAQKLAESAAVA